MTKASKAHDNFVVFPLGKKRFALSAEQVSELSRQKEQGEDEQQTFPHTSRLLTGVVLRRNQIVPVADIASTLIGADVPERKFYLIANLSGRGKATRVAVPVTGECELAEAERLPVSGKLPLYVSGLLSFNDEIVEVLDLERLIAAEVRA
jgi:chemotaxis signal transduction protein